MNPRRFAGDVVQGMCCANWTRAGSGSVVCRERESEDPFTKPRSFRPVGRGGRWLISDEPQRQGAPEVFSSKSRALAMPVAESRSASRLLFIRRMRRMGGRTCATPSGPCMQGPAGWCVHHPGQGRMRPCLPRRRCGSPRARPSSWSSSIGAATNLQGLIAQINHTNACLYRTTTRVSTEHIRGLDVLRRPASWQLAHFRDLYICPPLYGELHKRQLVANGSISLPAMPNISGDRKQPVTEASRGNRHRSLA
jgi:hypothetical protein